MAKKEKTKVRESKPLAETPDYDMDASTLADKLKQIQVDSNERRTKSAEERKARYDERSKSSKSQSSKGSGLQGLETSFGKKIITK